MKTFILSKSISFLFLILFLSFVALLFQEIRGGSASLVLAGQRASQSEIQKLKAERNEKNNIVIKYLKVLKNSFTLNFGNTIKGQNVMQLVISSFYFTFILASLASIFAFFYGVLTGVLSLYFKSVQKIMNSFNYFLLSTPIFILALFLLWTFSIFFSLFPPGGTEISGWYMLPALSLGLKAGNKLSLFTSEFLERELKKDYVLTYRIYNISKFKIYFLFIFKNMALPLFSFWLLDFASYLAGAAIIETIFSVPGIGSLLLKALFQYDINLLIGILMFIAVLIFLVSLFQDFLDRYYKKFTQNA